GGVEAGAPDGAGADELVVLLEHPVLRAVVDGIDGSRNGGPRRRLEVVARALVGQEVRRNRADDVAVEVRAQLAVVRYLADHGARQLPAVADPPHLLDPV